MTQRTEWVNEDDDPWITAPIVKRTVSARDAAPLAIKGPASVWDMAFAPIEIKQKPDAVRKTILRVERLNGVTNVAQVDVQDTQEYKERESARRAKQRPPRPTSGYKSMSKKFQTLIG